MFAQRPEHYPSRTFWCLVIALLMASCSQPEPKSYEDCILQKVNAGMSDTAAALVTQACRSKFPAALVHLEMKDLYKAVSSEGSLEGNTFSATLHNGISNIEISEVTFIIHTQSRIDKSLEEIRSYRVPVDLKPLQVANVSLNIVIDNGFQGYVLFSAKGIRRGDATPPRSGS